MNKILLFASRTNFKANRITTLIMAIFLGAGLSAQKLHTTLFETWTNGAWTNSVRETRSYDGSNYLIQTVGQDWDDISDAWINVSQHLNTNNTDGTPSQTIVQSWDEDTQTWGDAQRITYTYNASGKQLTSIVETAIGGGAYMNSFKQTHTYNDDGFLINTLGQTWNFLSSDWQNATQSTNTLNSNGLPVTELTQLWNAMASTWSDNERVTYTYNTDGRVLTAKYEDVIGGIFTDVELDTFTYDASGFLIHSLSQTWDVGSTAWVNSNQLNMTNNTDGSLAQTISQNWELPSGPWVNAERITYTYTGATGLERFTTVTDLAIIYPNPAYDVITIKLSSSLHTDSKFYLIDQTGRTVMTGRLSEETTTLNIGALNKGIYYLRFIAAPGIIHKVIKK